MTPSTPKMINSLIFKPSAGTSPWTGLLIALLCAFLLPGCGKSTNSKLDLELAALDSSTPDERETALLHLKDIAGGEAAAPKAIKLLKDDSAGVRTAAIGLLAKFKTPEALTALGSLAANDPDEGVQGEAMAALLGMGATDKYIEVCIAFVNGADAGKQSIGANGLQQVDAGVAEAAQDALLARLKDGSAEVRSQCAYALGNLGAKATAETKTALEAAAKDADKDVAEAGKAALESLNQ